MDISEDGIHVGLLQFGSYKQLRVEFGMNQFYTPKDAVLAVERITYLNGGGTALGSALIKTAKVRANGFHE